MTTKTSENVMCPIAWATVPSGMKFSRCTKTRNNAVPITISGVTSVASEIPLEAPAPRPFHRVNPIANATPSGTVTRTAIAASRMLWRSAVLRVGSWRTDRSGSPVYQRVDHPCAVDRDRPSLNENLTATRIGTIDQTR